MRLQHGVGAAASRLHVCQPSGRRTVAAQHRPACAPAAWITAASACSTACNLWHGSSPLPKPSQHVTSDAYIVWELQGGGHVNIRQRHISHGQSNHMHQVVHGIQQCSASRAASTSAAAAAHLPGPESHKESCRRQAVPCTHRTAALIPRQPVLQSIKAHLSAQPARAWRPPPMGSMNIHHTGCMLAAGLRLHWPTSCSVGSRPCARAALLLPTSADLLSKPCAVGDFADNRSAKVRADRQTTAIPRHYSAASMWSSDGPKGLQFLGRHAGVTDSGVGLLGRCMLAGTCASGY